MLIIIIICGNNNIAYADDTSGISVGNFIKMAQEGTFEIITPFITSFVQELDIMAHKGFQALSGPALTGAEYVFAISIITYTSMLVLGMINAQKFSQTIAVRCVIMFVVSAMLGSHGTPLYWTVFYDKPIEITSNISMTLMSIGSDNVSSCSNTNLDGSLLCIGANAGKSLSAPIKLALVMIAGTAQNMSPFAPITSINHMAAGLIGGVILICIYLGLQCYVAICLADIAMQITILSAVAPLFIASTLNNYTRVYAKRATEKLLGTMVHIIGIAISTGIMDHLLAMTLPGEKNSFNQSIPNSIAAIQAGNDITIFSKTYIFAILLGIFYIATISQISRLLEGIFQSPHAPIIHDHIMPIMRRQGNGASEWVKMRLFNEIVSGKKEDNTQNTNQTTNNNTNNTINPGNILRKKTWQSTMPKQKQIKTPYFNPFKK